MLNAMINKPWSFTLCMAFAMVLATMPEFAFAAGTAGGTIGRVLCGVVEWFTGPVGKGIATLAIIVIGVGALMGKVSWGMAIIVGVGVAVVFGAKEIVDELAVNGGGGCLGASSI